MIQIPLHAGKYRLKASSKAMKSYRRKISPISKWNNTKLKSNNRMKIQQWNKNMKIQQCDLINYLILDIHLPT